MKRFILSLIFSILCFSFSHLYSMNADADSIKPTYHLQEVVITEERIFDPPYAYSEISAPAMNAYQVTNVGDALRIVNGINIRGTGKKGESSFYLRGFDQRGVVLLMDGHPIYEPYFGSMDLSQIPVAHIAKIKIIKGPASALYGANALGGAINIVTRRAGTVPETNLDFNYGSGENYRFAAQRGQKIGNFNYWVSVLHNRRIGFEMSDKFSPTVNEDGNLRNNSDMKSTNWDAKLGWDVNENSHVSFSAGYLNSEKGIPPTAADDRIRFWRFSNWDKHYFDLSGNYRLSKKLNVRVKLFQDFYDNTLVSYQNDSYDDRQWTSVYNNTITGSSVQFDVDFSKNHKLTTGINFKQDQIEIQSDAGQPWEISKIRTISLAVQDEFTPHRRWSFLAGLGYDRLKGLTEWNQSIFGPQAGAVFRVLDNTSLHILVGEKSRFPSIKEWHESILYDVRLKPEKAFTWDAGIQTSVGQLFRSRLSIYHTDVTDLITRKSKFDPYENLATAQLRGLEIDLALVPNSVLQFNLAYHLLDAIDSETKQKLDYRPKHNFSLFTELTTLKNTKFNLHFNYVSERYYYMNDEMFSLGGYYLLNANISRNLSEVLEFRMGITNLLDEYYEDEAGFPMPGREFSTGVNVKF